MGEKFLNINFQEINKCNEDILSRDNFVNNICLLLNDKLLENIFYLLEMKMKKIILRQIKILVLIQKIGEYIF